MVTVSLSDIQKNISLLSNIKTPIRVRDKRKNIDVVTVYPVSKSKKSSILDIAWSLKVKKDILDKSSQMDFSEIKKEAIKKHLRTISEGLQLKTK